MNILSVGINHRTAPVEIRERLAIEPESSEEIFQFFRESEPIIESFILSTCNRVETIVTTDYADKARDLIVSLMSKRGNLSVSDLLSVSYTFEDMDAVGHIFKVASGLDSMVMGEPQILGQIKDAYLNSVRHGATGVVLNRLLHKSFHVAKRVRTETGISESAVSVSYAAVELARKIFSSLEDKNVLLIGAGEMAELTAKHLVTQGVNSLLVANRTFERAIEVAHEFDAKAISFEEIEYHLASDIDIVVSQTASPGYIITRDMIRRCIRKRRNRPLFFIDIAVPRDIEPEVNLLSNVYVYDIDDLKGVVQLNKSKRQAEAVKAERIVAEEIIKFDRWLKTLEVVPTIVSLQQKADKIINAELKKSRRVLNDLTPEQLKYVEVLVRSVSDKLLNDPLLFLKKKSGRPAIAKYLDFTKKLFNLDEDEEN